MSYTISGSEYPSSFASWPRPQIRCYSSNIWWHFDRFWGLQLAGLRI